MTFVTKLLLQSGDRAALDRVVDDIRDTCRRKGAQLKGPHSNPTASHRVAQYKRLDGEGTYDPWEYTVYERELEIHGHDDIARDVAQQAFPESIHVEVEVERVEPMS
jgi:small subunit ribosomal protein S10